MELKVLFWRVGNAVKYNNTWFDVSISTGQFVNMNELSNMNSLTTDREVSADEV